MPLTNAYRDYVAAFTTGSSQTAFTNATAHIGVGSGTTAFAATQTDLVGPSKARKGMDSGYPTRSGGVMTFRATFGTGDANFAWNEWGVFNAASGGTMMTRLVQNNGTKANTETKQMTVTVTLSV